MGKNLKIYSLLVYCANFILYSLYLTLVTVGIHTYTTLHDDEVQCSTHCRTHMFLQLASCNTGEVLTLSEKNTTFLLFIKLIFHFFEVAEQ